MLEVVASIFCRVSINLVTIICGVVYGARNRRTVHLFSHFLLRAKLNLLSKSDAVLNYAALPC